MNRHYNLLHTLVLLLALCFSFQAQPAGAGQESFSSVTARARACGVSAETLDRVGSEVDSSALSESDGASLLLPVIEACDLKLPLAPFEDKLAEGLFKHVAPPLIVRALQTRVEDYVFVRSLLPGPQDKIDPRLIMAMGEGVSRGTPRADIAAFAAEFSKQPAESFLIGAEMVSLLGQARFDYALTRTLLEAGFAEKALTPEWRFFIRLVLNARQRGLTDKAVAEAAAGVLAERGGLNDVYARLGLTARSLTGRPNSN